MKIDFEKIKAIARPLTKEERADIEHHHENFEWLMLSVEIAADVLRILEEKNMTQAELAGRMGVSSAQISKLVSGKINFEIKTICKLEAALGETLIFLSPRFPAYFPVWENRQDEAVQRRMARREPAIMPRSVRLSRKELTALRQEPVIQYGKKRSPKTPRK